MQVEQKAKEHTTNTRSQIKETEDVDDDIVNLVILKGNDNKDKMTTSRSTKFPKIVEHNVEDNKD